MLNSPYRLTALMIACCLLSVAGFLGGNVHTVHTRLPMMIPCFLCAVVGYLGMLWTTSVLTDAIQNERWPAETLTPFRLVIDHVLWKIGMGLLLVAMLAALILDRHRHGWFWAVFFLIQAQTQFTSVFARRCKQHCAGPYLDWTQVSPLRSEHWGER